MNNLPIINSGLRVNPVGGGLGLGQAAAVDNIEGGVAGLNPLVDGADGQEEGNDSGLDDMGADEPQVRITQVQYYKLLALFNHFKGFNALVRNGVLSIKICFN